MKSNPLADVPPEVRPITEAARRAVRAAASGADEIHCESKKPRSASMMWKLLRYLVDGEMVVTIGTFTKHSSIFFARGSELRDPGGLLQGTGKKLRYVTLRTPADAKSAGLEELLRSAFALASAAVPAPRIKRRATGREGS